MEQSALENMPEETKDAIESAVAEAEASRRTEVHAAITHLPLILSSVQDLLATVERLVASMDKRITSVTVATTQTLEAVQALRKRIDDIETKADEMMSPEKMMDLATKFLG